MEETLIQELVANVEQRGKNDGETQASLSVFKKFQNISDLCNACTVTLVMLPVGHASQQCFFFYYFAVCQILPSKFFRAFGAILDSNF